MSITNMFLQGTQTSTQRRIRVTPKRKQSLERTTRTFNQFAIPFVQSLKEQEPKWKAFSSDTGSGLYIGRKFISEDGAISMQISFTRRDHRLSNNAEEITSCFDLRCVNGNMTITANLNDPYRQEINDGISGPAMNLINQAFESNYKELPLHYDQLNEWIRLFIIEANAINELAEGIIEEMESDHAYADYEPDAYDCYVESQLEGAM